jgi:hypothetical protein
VSRELRGTAARLFVWAWIVNFGWEMAQAPLYAPMGPIWTAIGQCVRASVGDAGIVVALWVVGAYIFGSPDWFRCAGATRIVALALIGGLISVGLERAALSAGRWAYRSAMPVIPGLGVGLTPVLQMALLPTLILRFAGSRAARV